MIGVKRWDRREGGVAGGSDGRHSKGRGESRDAKHDQREGSPSQAYLECQPGKQLQLYQYLLWM